MNCLSLQQIYIQLRNEYRRRQSVSIATMKIMQKYNHVYELLVFWMASNSNHTNPPPAVAAWTYSTTGPDWGVTDSQYRHLVVSRQNAQARANCVLC